MTEQAARPPATVDGELHPNHVAMSHETRIRELLEKILESNCSPEEACADCPELLPEVRTRWRRLRRFQGRVDELFPSSASVSRSATDPARHFPEPKLPQIAGYEVLGMLGHGGMGVVYKAHHLKLNRDVALKMLLSGPYSRPQERARLMREAEAIARLQHPHIVQVHDVGELEGHPYFTMELLEGGTLARQLHKGPQSARASAQLVALLAAAVGFAHDHGIMHRDLKPANILLTADGTPKIADFGLARRLDISDDLTVSGTRLGTPSYMAPEQASGQTSAVGPRVDIYALGAILYEMLTGRPPFRAETAIETERQVISVEPARPSKVNASVPRDLENICLKCLNKDPQRRYSSAIELAEDLERFLDGKPVLARPVGMLERLVKWVRRRPGVAGLLASLVTLAVAGLVVGFRVERQRADERAKVARQEGRVAQAIEAALEQTAALREQGRLPAARAMLSGAARILTDATPQGLGEKLLQASADAEMVAELEEIRLRFSDGGARADASIPAERRYEEVFRKYGITLAMPPEQASERIRRSAIRDTLVAYLHDWLQWVSPKDLGRVLDLADRADDDEWRRNFRKALVAKDALKLNGLATTAIVTNQPPVVLSSLGGTLLVSEYRTAALAMLRAAQLRYPSDYWVNYLLAIYWKRERPQEAVGYLRAAIAIRPTSERPYLMLGKLLGETGDSEGAIANIRQANAINSKFAFSSDLAQVLAGRADLEEARAGWEKLLEHTGNNHDPWFGYAELCLYIGNQKAYEQARRELLKRFGKTYNNWIVGERTSVACLLAPPSPDELRITSALVERAVVASGKSSDAGNAYIRFVQGLAAYRLGQYEAAKPFLSEAQEKLPNRSAPLLVLAMAEFRSGSKSDALNSLSLAVRISDWSPTNADNQVIWVGHVLRHEAEDLILPNLPAFRQGKYQPKDQDERLALLGTCQDQSRWKTAAQLYRNAFAADPNLSEELTEDCLERSNGSEFPSDKTLTFRAASRYSAARFAALAGAGLGSDAANLSQAERKAWRDQARQWLRADLTGWTKMLKGDSPPDRDFARRMLEHWRTDPELAGLRDVDAIAALPEAEAAECRNLWAQVDPLIYRDRSAK